MPPEQGLPPAFGHRMRARWRLDPRILYLNHGTVGATPVEVLQAQQALRDEIERQPAAFLLRELGALSGPAAPGRPALRLRSAAGTVGAFVGARGEDLAFVDNASSGVNAVLRSLPLRPGDEIVLLSHAYGAVRRIAAFVARERGARVVEAALPFPIADAGDAVAAVVDALTPRTRIAVLDHVSSESALVLPLAAMAAECRSRGVAVLADGAHAPGAIALDIASLGVDWYAANLHKWAFAPRSCGLLWARPDRQHGLHPAVVSWGLDEGWLREFDWTGTRDPTPWLAAPAGLDFMRRALGVDAMRAHNRSLALHARQLLGERLGQPPPAPDSMIGCMASIALPPHWGADAAAATRLRDRLLFERAIEVPVVAIAGRLHVRVSAQVYNETADLDALADALQALGGD